MNNRINGRTPSSTTPLWLADLRRLNGSARAEVERLFLTALLTLDALPDRELRHFEIRTAWPLCPRDGWFGYQAEVIDDDIGVALRARDALQEPETFVPSPADHDRMLIALAWGRTLTRQQWRIAHARAEGYSWPGIGDRLRLPPRVVRSHYHAALATVCSAALDHRR